MRLLMIACLVAVASLTLARPSLAVQDRLAGRWEGKLQAPQGEMPAVAVFKKDGDKYTGTITGVRGDIQLNEVKLDGDKVTAKAQVETPQATVDINYVFNLEGDSLKGTGSVDINGNPFSFEIALTRAAEGAAGAQSPPPTPPRPRVEVPQPQQKRSIDYFAGQWSFKYVGRESELGPAPREGLVVFTKRADGNSVDGNVAGKSDAGAYKESLVIVYDDASKMLAWNEKLANGVMLVSKGDWTSPITIRFAVDPVKAKNKTIQLHRTMTIVAAHTFTVTEELSEDGGPFMRLGTAVFTRAN
jgi:hypothetical protein